MTIKRIAKDACETCQLLKASGCPVMESCPTDVIRLDKEGFPYVAYLDDCMSCFLCEIDCPEGAVKVSAEVPLPFIPSE